jgi:hypothetical protein
MYPARLALAGCATCSGQFDQFTQLIEEFQNEQREVLLLYSEETGAVPSETVNGYESHPQPRHTKWMTTTIRKGEGK